MAAGVWTLLAPVPAHPELADEVKLTGELRDAAGALTNATVSVVVTKPDGTTLAPAATVTTPNTGTYTATLALDQAGTWLYRWVAAGTLVAVGDGQVTAVAQRALVADLAELKKQLNRLGGDRSDDEELRGYLESATDFVEWATSGPVSVQTFTERIQAEALAGWRAAVLVVSRRPLVSVTSLTPVSGLTLGTALASSTYRVDTTTDLIELDGYWCGRFEVVYKAGRTGVPAGMKLAGLIVAQHLWQTQNGSGGRPSVGEEVLLPGAAWAVPYRAAELLRPYMLPGVA